MLNEALRLSQSILAARHVLFFSPFLSLSSVLSSNLNSFFSIQAFHLIRVATIYTLSFNLSLFDVVLGYQFTSCLACVRPLKAAGMMRSGAFTAGEYEASPPISHQPPPKTSSSFI